MDRQARGRGGSRGPRREEEIDIAQGGGVSTTVEVAIPNRSRVRSHAARHQLLIEWNDTEAPDGRRLAGDLFPELFVQRAARTPDAVAVLAGGEHLTYRQLERVSRRLAGVLRRHGVGGETRVGLFCERSPGMVTGALGILRASAVYVPLDPQYPDARIRWMIEDAGITHVVTRSGLRSRLDAGGKLTVTCVDWGNAVVDTLPAEINLYRDRDRPSYLELPIIPSDTER